MLVALAGVLAVLVGTAGCSPGSDPRDSGWGPVPDGGPWATVDALARARFADRGIPVTIRIVQHGAVVHDRRLGGAPADGAPEPAIRIASASKWLTAATVLTLVDEGRLDLDAPIGSTLPAFTGDKARITLRQLLSHTSGLREGDCLWDRGTTLAACVGEIAGADLADDPGARFHYGNTSFHVAARLAEVAGGAPFQDLFARRIAGPLGLTATRFDGGTATTNPTPAASGSSTVADYERFLAMLTAGGRVGDRRVLSEASVRAILHDQVSAAQENPSDGAVVITGIPRYGFGCWLDEVDAAGDAVVVSGSGSLGAYPFIDRADDAYGLVWVEDPAHSDGRAVRDSAAVAHAAITVLRRGTTTGTGPGPSTGSAPTTPVAPHPTT